VRSLRRPRRRQHRGPIVTQDVEYNDASTRLCGRTLGGRRGLLIPTSGRNGRIEDAQITRSLTVSRTTLPRLNGGNRRRDG